MSHDIQQVARDYIAAGWSVVPLVAGEKRANSSWRKKTYGPDDFGVTDGIAGKCGDPSGDRVDIDCDAMEAVTAAKILLPQTGLIHGRPGKPDSHYWYICPGIKTHQFLDIKDQTSGGSAMLIEIRSTGGYTALPPSHHPSGEQLLWTIERDPLVLDPISMYEAARDVAVAALIARHYPTSGARHTFAGPIAGFLCHAGVVGLRALKIVEAAARGAKDTDLRDRLAFAQSTIDKFTAGEKVTGGPKLIDSLGEHVVSKLRAWFKMADGDALEDMNAKHFVVRLGKDEVIGTEEGNETYFQFKKALELRYSNRFVQVGVDQKSGQAKFEPVLNTWLKWRNRREYRSVTFAPQPRIADPKDYNLWRGFAIEPIEGNCDPFLVHLLDVICSGDDHHYQYLLNLLALTIQQPGVPSEIAVVLRGEAGTGKGVFVRALGDIFGRHYTHLDKTDDLVGQFNAAISGKCIVFADEAFWAGDKRDLGALKRLITEPTLRITRKGIDSTLEHNCVHLFIATNDEWSFPAMFKERRVFALKVSSCKRGDFRYFGDLAEHQKNGGLAAFLHFMLTFPVDTELIRNVPKTAELRVQQAQSMSPVMEWWQDCLFEGSIGRLGWPSGWQPVSEIYEIYFNWSDKHRARVMSKIEFSRRMGMFLSDREISVRRGSTGAQRSFKVRMLDDARKCFDHELGTVNQWPPDGVTATGSIPF